MKKICLFLLLGLFFITSGCGSSSNTAKSSSGLNCSGDNPDTACAADDDNDALNYLQETKGWNVFVDRVGTGIGEPYMADSDPEKVDTDSDGLSDFEEFINKTDPRNPDTDGDGLTDGEELNRWSTNPLSVDTDGDSRGPNGDLTPNPRLFDSAELNIDLENDPGHSPGNGATSPLNSDTDGDGWSDYYELVEASGQGFLAHIADVPELGIKLADSPVIRLVGSYASGSSWSRDVSVTDSLATSVSSESSISQSSEYTIETTTGFGTEFGFEAGGEIGTESKFVGNISGSVSSSFSLSAAMTSSESVAWTEGKAREAETAYQESMGEGTSEEITLTGGTLTLAVMLVNTGDITFTLSDLRVNVLARYMNGTNHYAPVLELVRANDQPLTLSPSQEVNIMLTSTTEDYDLIRSFLKNPSGLMFEVASYSLSDKDGVNFGFSEETIKQKSAMVVIDYGGELAPERYLVATNPARQAGQTGVAMSTIMQNILQVTYETKEVLNGDSSYRILSKVRSIEENDALHQKWLVATTSATVEQNGTPDFDDMVLQAGDVIYCIFVRDRDSDGLSAREEFLLGTSDQEEDTDNDGLTDYEETREGWTVKVDGQLGYKVRSKGYTADSDMDTLTDDFEKQCGLDPLREDTDQDGISDSEELYGYDIMQGDQFVTRVTPYTGVVILDGGDAAANTAATGDDVETNDVDAGSIVILAGENETIESIPGDDDFIAAPHRELLCEPAGFATDPLSMDTDGESISDGLEKQLALGHPNNPGDFSVYIDTDGDGLSDAAEDFGFGSRVNGNAVYYVSDKNSADSDNDNLPDLLEYMIGTNPMKADTDNDGLSDFDEYDFELEWNAFTALCGQAQECSLPDKTASLKYGTNPVHWDTDNDGLSDGAELAGWTIRIRGEETYLPYHAVSDPFDADTDNDGWSDAREKSKGTDPKKVDTDGDGTYDSQEESIAASSYWHRSPLTRDRKITVTYGAILYSGECEKLFGIFNDFEEVRYSLRIKYPNTSHFSGVADSNGDETVDAYKKWTLNEKVSFIATYGETFELAGFVQETDGDYSDAALRFGPVGCIGCESFLSGTFDVTSNTRFTVDGQLSTTALEYNTQPGKKCGCLDDNSGLKIYDFSVTVTGEVKVE